MTRSGYWSENWSIEAINWDPVKRRFAVPRTFASGWKRPSIEGIDIGPPPRMGGVMIGVSREKMPCLKFAVCVDTGSRKILVSLETRPSDVSLDR
jgi:hypothetical protein